MLTNKYIFFLRKKFRNKNVFILGSAPSILKNDLKQLKNRNTFGINSSTLLAIDNDFSQTFYISTDDKVENCLLKKVKDDITIWDCGTTLLDKKTIRFMPTFIQKYDNLEDCDRTFYYTLRGSVNENVFYNSFSNKITEYIHRYYMTPSSAIEICCYLGFKNIFILGVDIVYPKSGSHFYNNTTAEYSKEDLGKIKQADDFCKWIYYVNKKIHNRGQQIYSCSPTSKLNNVIDYISFEKAIQIDNVINK